MKQMNLLAELIEIHNSERLCFSLYIKKNKYQLDDVIISKKSTPLTEKTLRGGAYISDKFVYQISATIFDPSLANSLSDFMLGPNFEFKDITISVNSKSGKWNSASIIVNLVSSVQKQTSIELTMNVINILNKD